ncbi:ester cyclase [Paenibacillus athensensis]|uniref:Ester cyclase n=1 Tax=Paenibacillus athensensis TaxID=1967502 RepID=A0A4Y8Q584_9BACL|nr:ester cyclase [Paenibacillus athensensis]MCD1259563.1 ester cyclase [Paenibacillus athensensis]
MSMHSSASQPAVTDPKRLVADFIESFWNGRDISCTEHFLHADYIDHAYQPATAEGLKTMLGQLSSAFPDHRQTVEQLVCEGDFVMARLTLHGTHQGEFRGTSPTGLAVTAPMYRTFRLADGRIAEHWALFDLAGLLRQIGGTLDDHTACRIR